jgi:hypothetical protein
LSVLLLPWSVAAENYQPVYFDGTKTLSFKADVRLHPGRSGTIELWLAAPENIREPFVTVLRHGSEDDAPHYRVGLFGDRKRMYLETLGPNSASIEAAVDLTDGLYHHVAFVVDGGMTRVLVDGAWAGEGGPGTDAPRRDTIKPTPFLPVLPTGRSLHIGGEPGRYFSGWVYTVRIWNKPLNELELEWTKQFYGWPQYRPSVDSIGFKSLTDSLIAYSSFTQTEQRLYYPNPQVYLTPMVGGQQGKSFFIGPYFSGPSAESYGRIKRILAQILPPRITRFVVQHEDALGRSIAMPRNEGQDIVADTQFAEEWPASWMALHDKTGFQQRVQRLNQLQFGFDPESTDDLARQQQHDFHVFQLFPGQQLTAVSGTHNYQQIETLRFHTNQGMSEVFRQNPAQNGFAPFHISVPPGASFAGITATTTEQGYLESIGLAYTAPEPSDEEAQLNFVAAQRWVDRNQPLPMKRFDIKDPAFDDRHGTYTVQPVYRFRTSQKDTQRSLLALSESGHSGNYVLAGAFTRGVGSTPYSKALERLSNQYYQPLPHWDEGRGSIFLDGRLIRFYGSMSILPTTLETPTPYETGTSDKISWGGTFSLDQRPTLLKANFQGYNMLRMDPRNFQANTGAPGMIFAYPQEGSKNFYPTDNKIIVPHGLILVSDNEGDESSDTTTVSTESEHKSAWSVHMGASVGIPLIFSFKENGSYQEEMSRMQKNNLRRVISKSVETRYALVLDRARMQPSDEMYARVMEMRDRTLAGLEVNYADFIASFGTHYANAVTYGGMAFLEIDFTEQEQQIATANQTTIEAEASGMLEELSLGVSGGGSKSISDRLTKTKSRESIRFQTLGGSMSRGEGWSLPKGEEVPVYLDLRPIYEVLSPLYFDDEVVWTELRRGLSDHWNALMGVAQ